MNRALCVAALAVVCLTLPGVSLASVTGDYLEMRTCDIFTGPCFANAEVGVTGRNAVLAWSIDAGQYEGVDLTGLKVVLAVNASDTLAYGGGMAVRPEPIQSVIITDARATAAQKAALVSFVKAHAKKLAGSVARVESAEISMNLNHVDMTAELKAGDKVELRTRKLGQGDCVCTNEELYYPPLAKVENAAPAYARTKFAAQGLGTNFSHLGRSAYLATFNVP